MARGGHHRSGGHSGSHHRSSSRSSSSRSRSSSSHSYSSFSRSRGGSYGSSSSSTTRSSVPQGPPPGVESYNGNWITEKSCRINRQDPYVKAHIAEAMGKEYPVEKYFPAFMIIMFFIYASNLFYEIVIPIFENMNMSDNAFSLIDGLVYATPLLTMATGAVAFILYTMKKRARARAFCTQIIEYYRMEKKKQEVALATQQKLNAMEFYEECPNCGAPVKHGSMNCEYCDSSLVKENA